MGCKKKLNINILMSYAYQDDLLISLIPKLKNFMLDSGAFTLFRTKQKCDFDLYIEQYAKFINKYKIELFFELDIDKLIGYQEVVRLRHKLEKLTGKPCIPVWHVFRGKQNFIDMCKEYKYVAIGGMVDDNSFLKYLPWFIKTAHEQGCKIHGLGCTGISKIKKYHFDSVDSSAWTTGNRFGYLYKFNGKEMIKIHRPKGTKLKDSRAVAQYNFNEWIKFQEYARNKL